MLTKCKTANTSALIQFGHNDQKVMTTTQFATNLTSLTKMIENAGCLPILLTSLACQTFSSEYTTSDRLGPYSAEAIKVASDLGLPVSCVRVCVDDKLDELNHASNDTTHLNALGAKYFRGVVADEVKAKISALSSYIVSDATLSEKVAAGSLELACSYVP
ncbi:hypothetical protein RSAG8_04250, partial [Rhizoctonia solani AG-8 WAC10335]